MVRAAWAVAVREDEKGVQGFVIRHLRRVRLQMQCHLIFGASTPCC